MDTTSVPQVERHDHDDQDGTPHGCIAGVVYIGHLVEDPETGDELEAFDAVPCRRCQRSYAGDDQDL